MESTIQSEKILNNSISPNSRLLTIKDMAKIYKTKEETVTIIFNSSSYAYNDSVKKISLENQLNSGINVTICEQAFREFRSSKNAVFTGLTNEFPLLKYSIAEIEDRTKITIEKSILTSKSPNRLLGSKTKSNKVQPDSNFELDLHEFEVSEFSVPNKQVENVTNINKKIINLIKENDLLKKGNENMEKKMKMLENIVNDLAKKNSTQESLFRENMNDLTEELLKQKKIQECLITKLSEVELKNKNQEYAKTNPITEEKLIKESKRIDQLSENLFSFNSALNQKIHDQEVNNKLDLTALDLKITELVPSKEKMAEEFDELARALHTKVDLKIDQLQGTRTQRKRFKCSFCSTDDHEVKNCEYAQNYFKQHPRYCFYCNQEGHLYGNCYRAKRNNQLGSQNSNNINNNNNNNKNRGSSISSNFLRSQNPQN